MSTRCSSEYAQEAHQSPHPAPQHRTSPTGHHSLLKPGTDEASISASIPHRRQPRAVGFALWRLWRVSCAAGDYGQEVDRDSGGTAGMGGCPAVRAMMRRRSGWQQRWRSAKHCRKVQTPVVAVKHQATSLPGVIGTARQRAGSGRRADWPTGRSGVGTVHTGTESNMVPV